MCSVHSIVSWINNFQVSGRVSKPHDYTKACLFQNFDNLPKIEICESRMYKTGTSSYFLHNLTKILKCYMFL